MTAEIPLRGAAGARDGGHGSFDPPGPGSWVLDKSHFTGPVTRFVREAFSAPTERGFRAGTRPYGLLLDHIAWGFVDHWPYLSPRRVDGLETEDLTREGWERLVASSPSLGERLATSAKVFEQRLWRDDVDVWDRRVKPAAIRANEGLAHVDAASLGADRLAAYVDRSRRNLCRALYRHHRFNVAAVLAVGDFLVHAEEWTGLPAARLLGPLRGSTPLYLGAGDQLAAVAGALGSDHEAVARLGAGDDAGAIIDWLRRRPGETGASVVAYLNRVADWPVGSGADIGDPRLAEEPAVLLRTIEAVLDGGAVAADSGVAEETAELRQAVPAPAREAFDEQLAEARATYRLRDERATFCDVWAFGLMRRALLAVGDRLADVGAVGDPVHLLEADHTEVRALLLRRGGPSATELAERAHHRTGARFDDAPPFLGPPPAPPVPVEWLSAGAARTERAFRAYVEAMSDEPGPERPLGAGGAGPEDAVRSGVRGMGASPGQYEGTARVLHGADELSRVQEGDVLVTGSTSPAFNVVLPLLGAIVTDRGGLLSHAAIVAREYGLPAVVGAIDATGRIHDGTRVRVDGDTGEVATVD